MKLANIIAENAPMAVQMAKEIAVRACEFEKGFVLENALFQKVSASEDAQEGPRAYAEKRSRCIKAASRAGLKWSENRVEYLTSEQRKNDG